MAEVIRKKSCILILLSIYLLATTFTYMLFAPGRTSLKSLDPPLPSHTCNPFMAATQQYYATIDNTTYPTLVPSFFNASLNFTCLNARNLTKTILLWNTWYDWLDYKYGLGRHTPFAARHCPVHHCELTYNRSLLPLSDLVVVNHLGLVDEAHMPPISVRSARTRLVLHTNESPMLSPPVMHSSADHMFDLVAYYKADADFAPFYYADVEFEWRPSGWFDAARSYLAGKSKLAAALVSNCRAVFSRRMEVIEEMRKWVPVDVYGACGMSCNIENENRLLDSKKCREKIAKDYMFFLAFENSICEDYVTEKLFETVLYDIVPVVYGGAKYEKWLPRSAYINVADFPSIRSLTEYLTYLSTNATAYNAYFSWKKHITVTNVKYNVFCDMCIKLHLEDFEGVKRNVVKDFAKYFGAKQNCKRAVLKDGKLSFWSMI